MRLELIVLPVFMAITSVCYGQGCSHSPALTQDFLFRASSDHGAVGDVVAIELSLMVKNIHGGIRWYEMTVAYDELAVELVGYPQYSDIHDQVIAYKLYYGIPDEQRLTDARVKAVSIAGLFNTDGIVDEILAAGNVLPIATLYFRITGQPGESSLIRFSDEEFAYPDSGPNPGNCIDTSATFRKKDGESYPPSPLSTIEIRSTLNMLGEINIVPGEPTHTEIPNSPPLAKVYPEEPTPETASINFELTGGNVRPREIEVPVDLHITSNYEFSNYMAAGIFPSQYLTLKRIEDHTHPGLQYIDNSTGEFWFNTDLSRWRIGYENERVLVATLYFDVSQEAGEVETLPLELKTFNIQERRYKNWIGINSEQGNNDGTKIPIMTEVEPLIITQAALKIINEPFTLNGDANFDQTFDITDPVAVIAFLFQGDQEPDCPVAADFADDGQLDISDPVVMLSALFHGAVFPGPTEVPCR